MYFAINMGWIKDKLKRAWKWLTALFVGGIVIAQIMGIPPVEIPIDQRLKAPKEDIVLVREFTHRNKKNSLETRAISYAYRTNKKILPLENELVERRTSKNRYFTTNNPKVFVLEAVSEPQYYKNTSGEWWQTEYATASFNYYNQQISAKTLFKKLVGLIIKPVYAVCSGSPTSPCTSFPDADPETSTVDGNMSEETGTCVGDGLSLTNLRNAAGDSAQSANPAGGTSSI